MLLNKEQKYSDPLDIKPIQVVKQASVNISANKTKPEFPSASLTALVRITAPFSEPAKALDVTMLL